MAEEAERALEPWRPGTRLDLYVWTRRLALRVAMRALFGFDPDRGSTDMAEEFERALGYWGRAYAAADAARAGQPVSLDGDRARLARRRDLRRDRPPAAIRRARRGHPQPAARRDATRTARVLSDQELRDQVMTLLFAGPRHHDLDGDVPVLRAGPQPDEVPHCERPRGSRSTCRRDAAHVPARLDRPAALDRAVRAARRARPGRRARELLLVGEPSPRRGLPRAVRVPARALPPGCAGGAAEGRLRAVRRRLAHLHRDALRPARGEDDRGDDPAAASGSSSRSRSARSRSARCRRSRRAAGCR